MSINKVILIGNLGKDPDVRYTTSGQKVANFSIATTESWKDKSGQKQEKTDWHRVVIFNNLAEVAEKYLHKGSKVYVEGMLQTRKWTDNNNIERDITEVIVSIGGKLQMLDGKQTANLDAEVNEVAAANTDNEDEVPF